ncbi:MAG: hypothetical protein D6680_13040 [Cyanobacteria bacterium J007]|nr:MAG: hypothetical protein D6680_13040 [Cyanobacteria bacterium J007]
MKNNSGQTGGWGSIPRLDVDASIPTPYFSTGFSLPIEEAIASKVPQWDGRPTVRNPVFFKKWVSFPYPLPSPDSRVALPP